MPRPSAALRQGSILQALLLIAAVAGGCRAQELQAPPPMESPVERPTHRVVAQPPSARKDRLWVALEDHLGRGAGQGAPAPLLTLQSAGVAPLVLRSPGIKEPLQTAARLRFSWRSVPRQAPLELARQVAGPFASFESAERVATRWRGQGVQALVAHPNEWEVWAPEAALPLPDVPVRRVRETLTMSIQPVLEGAKGGRTLQGPLLIEAPDGLRWKGGVMRGPFRLQADAYGSWTLLEQVPLERYLEGVVPHEIGAGSPAAALEAQAVLARTWALANSHRFAIDGYHLCSDTQCQVYSDPRQAGASVRQAIKATAGQVLQWQGSPISAVYHASNGGVMAGVNEAWAMPSVPYLRSQADGGKAWTGSVLVPVPNQAAVEALLKRTTGAYGSGHPRFRWTRTYSAAQLQGALAAQAPRLGVVQAVSVLERGPSGRVLALQVIGDGPGSPVVLRLDGIRRSLRRLPSTLMVVEPAGAGVWRFRGGGFGHGAGLSQAGAIDLARQGWSVERILQHYYPGTTLVPLSALRKAP
jgi:SpoIID/LytB domain protein